MVFLPGDHTLDMNITVTNISRLMMRGESSSGYVAKVICNGSVGLHFMSMVDLKIHSLTFTACSRSFDEYYTYALLLESIEYAELINCSFDDNFGTALVLYQTSVTLAENNEFTHNHCDKWFMAIYCVSGGGISAHYSNLIFTGNTTFLQNYAMLGSGPADYGGGGAIYAVYNTSLSFTGTSNFINNSAAVWGGAILANYNTSVSFTGTSNFTNNSADYGGAIVAAIASLSFTGTTNFLQSQSLCLPPLITKTFKVGSTIYLLGITYHDQISHAVSVEWNCGKE